MYSITSGCPNPFFFSLSFRLEIPRTTIEIEHIGTNEFEIDTNAHGSDGLKGFFDCLAFITKV